MATSWSGKRTTAVAVLTIVAAGSVLAATALALGSSSGALQGGGDFGGCSATPVLEPVPIPSDMAKANQKEANCFAWQQFIALNWPADLETCTADTSVGPEGFGVPTDMAPVLWETYAGVTDVFRPGAEPPGPWCGSATNERKALDDVTPFRPDLDLDEFVEAAPEGAWVTAQGGFLTFIEIRLNEDEFEYIVDKGLYDADNQASVAASDGIELPAGETDYGDVGSIELKASWIELPDKSLYPFFKTREATLHYPGEDPKTAVVGLVGLHIIHKTPLAQQFVWATFEHRWNAPDADSTAAPPPGPGYNYYNPTCDPSTDHYGCTPNAAPDPSTDPFDAPVQVVREESIPSEPGNDVAGLNDDVKALIADHNEDSVFLNYQLVNVQWPSQSTPIGPGAVAPLPDGVAKPTDSQVANTTLETYVQVLQCLDCHVGADVATPDPNGVALQGFRAQQDSPDYASDYSFVFSRAHSGSSNPGDENGGISTPLVVVAAAAMVAVAGGATTLVVRRRRKAPAG